MSEFYQKTPNMIRFLYLVLLCLWMTTPLNSQDVDGGRNYTDINGKRQGYWEREYPNGSIQYRGYFKDGRPVGEFTRFFPNGNRLAEMFFCDKGRMARARLFFEDGSLAAEGNYIDEKKDGIWQYFSFYGSHLTSTETYDKGVREGISAVYYPDGKIAESFFYENGLRNGPWKQYYETGNLRLEAEFEDDMRHGLFISYKPGGRIDIEGRYSNNQMHGEWTFYDDSHQVVSVINYVDGRPENEEELILKEQEMFRKILEMEGRIPEPDESELFFNRDF